MSSKTEMEEFEEKVVTLAISNSGNNGNNNGRINIASSIIPPNRPKLAYDIKAKALRIINIKHDVDRYRRYLSISLLPFILGLVIIFIRIGNYIPNIEALYSNVKLFPSLKQLDIVVIIITITVTTVLYYLSKRYKSLNDKFESYRKDLISFLGSQVCFCNSVCNCRDAFIIVLDNNYGIKLY